MYREADHEQSDEQAVGRQRWTILEKTLLNVAVLKVALAKANDSVVRHVVKPAVNKTPRKVESKVLFDANRQHFRTTAEVVWEYMS